MTANQTPAAIPLAHNAGEADRLALAPEGYLRVAIAVGPASSPMWTVRDESTGDARGVTVDLGAALAGWLGVPVRLVEHASSGAIVEAAGSGTWDVGFAPVDDKRRTQVLFGPDYHVGQSTLLVPAGSPIRSLADADAPGTTIVGVENTATIRSARRVLTQANVVGVTGLDEALAMLMRGEAQAIGLGRDSLESLLPKLPGARVLDGHYHTAATAIAVPPTRPEALPVVTRFMDDAKTSGMIAAILARHGFAQSA